MRSASEGGREAEMREQAAMLPQPTLLHRAPACAQVWATVPQQACASCCLRPQQPQLELVLVWVWPLWTFDLDCLRRLL